MPVNFRAELAACFGQPVDENPTVVMQEAGFHHLHLNWRYLTIEVPPARLRDAVQGARAMGFRGFNLTIPHKIAVMEHLDEIAPMMADDCSPRWSVGGTVWLIGDRIHWNGSGTACVLVTGLHRAGTARRVVLGRRRRPGHVH